MHNKAVVFANGELIDEQVVRACIQPGDFLLAADGGHSHLKSMGLQPGMVIGDLDSLPPADLITLQAAQVPIKTFPREKDATDLELALRESVARGFSEVLIIAALGGRLDQTLGNLAVLRAPFLSKCRVTLEDGLNRIWLITPLMYPRGLCVDGHSGERLSLIALSEQVRGISTNGLKYPLAQEDLPCYATRGISNEMVAERAEIQINEGELLVMHTRGSTK
jgi:thiamine pyrophosphokinase